MPASQYPQFFAGKQRSELAKELKEANALIRFYRNTIERQRNELFELKEKEAE